MCETANQTKNFAELAGRTQPVVGDVVMAMINMGLSFDGMDVGLLLFISEFVIQIIYYRNTL